MRHVVTVKNFRISAKMTAKRKVQSRNKSIENDENQSPSLRVAFIPTPDFTLMALCGFIEALRIAADTEDRSRQIHCEWTVMTPDASPVRSSAGVVVVPSDRLRPPEDFDYIVVVGGLLKGHDNIDGAIYKYLKQAAKKNITLVGACTGSFVLARSGLMHNKRCCVHQFHLSDFEAEFPKLQVEADQLFIVQGNRITCPGGASVIDLAIYLIERHCGRDRALKTICQLIFDEARSSDHPQARIAFDWLTAAKENTVRRAILVMQQNIGSVRPISEISAAVGTNTRQLERMFKRTVNMSPTAFYRRLRLERALWLLEHSRKSMSIIAYECGFADSSHFGRLCKQVLGVTPSDVRKLKKLPDKEQSLHTAKALSDLIPRQ